MDTLREFAAAQDARDFPRATALAHDYVARNKTRLLALFGGRDVAAMVREVSAARREGREQRRIEADMWIMAELGPSTISGDAIVQLPATSQSA